MEQLIKDYISYLGADHITVISYKIEGDLCSGSYFNEVSSKTVEFSFSIWDILIWFNFTK